MAHLSFIKKTIGQRKKLEKILSLKHNFWLDPEILTNKIDKLDVSLRKEALKTFLGFELRSSRDLNNLEFNLVKGLSPSEEVVIWIDVQKFDKAWKKSGDDLYIYPGGEVGGIHGRYAGFIKFLEQENTPIEMSDVGISNGEAGFTNGRHRFATLRDAGVINLPVITNKRCVAEIQAYCV